MALKLYKMDISPPVRAAMMACDIFNVPVEMIEVNLLDGHNYNCEFLKKNPLHSIPVLEDNGLILHDSHAILMYLADVYGTDDSWYPKDTKRRALVNQKLFFDACILFPRLRNVTYSLVIKKYKTVDPKKIDDIGEAYGFLEKFLSRSTYIAGDQITIADLSAISDVTSLAHILSIDEKKYPRTLAWVNHMEKMPYCQKFNKPGVTILGKMIKHCRAF